MSPAQSHREVCSACAASPRPSPAHQSAFSAASLSRALRSHLCRNHLYPLALRNSQASSRTASSSSASSTGANSSMHLPQRLFLLARRNRLRRCGRNISKARPVIHRAVHPDIPLLASRFRSTVGRPEPGPFPSSLVVKNGSKILDFVCCVHPCPVSATTISTYFPAMTVDASAHTFDPAPHFGRHGQFALAHRVARVHREVHKHLLHLRRVRLSMRKPSPGRNLYSISSPSSTGIILFTSAIVAFKSSTCGAAPGHPAERQQLPRQPPCPVRRLFIASRWAARGVGLQVSSPANCCALDHRQQIIEVVRHPPASRPTASIFCECRKSAR